MTLIMMTLMHAILLPRVASCRLVGEAELSYVDFSSSDNSAKYSAHSLTQHYSVLYESSGKLVQGRLGKYSVSLGYDWLAFDTGINPGSAPSSDFSQSKGRIFYSGDVVLNPKELPLKLTLYGRDLNRAAFGADQAAYGQGYGQANVFQQNLSIPSYITTSISGGTRLDSGATLVAGVKNGMTNGYNEFLRHFPMLLLDYRNIVNKDGGISPVDNRFTRLAFVSLNKKDNWFHYRYVTYNDFIDSSNNYNESQFQLGTIDQLLQRRWIDFTNWLTVSADGQLTKHNDVRNGGKYEEFALNFFGTACRGDWELRTFNNFTRFYENGLDRVIYKTSLPVYANGTISPSASWNAYTKYNDTHSSLGESFSSASGGYTVDVFKKSSFKLSQSLNVEKVNTSNNSDSLIISGGVGTTSTSRFSRDLTLHASYNISDYRTDSGNITTNLIYQSLRGDVRYNLADNVRIRFGQSNRFSSGSDNSITSSLPGAQISSAQYFSPQDGTSVNGSTYQSTTDFGIVWTPKPRLALDLTASEDIYIPASGARSNLTKASASVNYSDSKLRTSSGISFSSGKSGNSDAADVVVINSNVSYIFSRSLDARATAVYSKTYAGTNEEVISVEQGLNYSYFQNNGYSRKLFEISETFATSNENRGVNIDTNIASRRRTNLFVLGAKYYPLRQMMIAGGSRYSFDNNNENVTLSYYGSLSVQFRLLEAGLDYTYGKIKTDNKVEKRFMANLKKKF